MSVDDLAPMRALRVVAVVVVVAIGLMHGVQAFAHSTLAGPSTVETHAHGGSGPAGTPDAPHDHAGAGHGLDGHAMAALCLLAVLAALVAWRTDRPAGGVLGTPGLRRVVRLVGPEPPVPRLVA